MKYRKFPFGTIFIITPDSCLYTLILNTMCFKMYVHLKPHYHLSTAYIKRQIMRQNRKYCSRCWESVKNQHVETVLRKFGYYCLMFIPFTIFLNVAQSLTFTYFLKSILIHINDVSSNIISSGKY